MTPVTLTQEDIEKVTASFYAKVQDHAVLGPVFAAHVDDWPSHIDRISRFWRNAILREKVYDGNPMIKHQKAGNVEIVHFEIWLSLFDETLHEHLPPPIAQAWSEIAHRIGRSLKMGLARSITPSF